MRFRNGKTHRKFFSEGVRVEGDLFLPDGLKAGERRPGIVLCHGFTGIRSFILGDYAKVFVEAGFVALTFDYRGFGGSEGTKWRLIPLEQIDDIRNTISFVETLPEVDPERIGLWGTSFGGGHAPYAAAIDTRIKAAVGQVGFGDGERFLLDTRIFGERAELVSQVESDRRRRSREVPKNEGRYLTDRPSPQFADLEFLNQAGSLEKSLSNRSTTLIPETGRY